MRDALRFWDKIAPRYAKSPVADVPAYEYTLERVRSYLKPSDHVLELGAGTGTTALILSDAAERVVASDLSPVMTEIGRAKARDQGIETVDFVAAGLHDAALEGGQYDVVMAMNLLHLLPDTAAAVRRAHSLLGPGGLFISKSVCQPIGGLSLKFRVMRAVLPLMQWLGKAPFVKFMTIGELEATILDGGFDIIETGNYPANPPNHFVVARKL